MVHLSRDQLEAGLDDVRASPAREGQLDLIVRRPAVDERELLEEGVLSLEEGLVGDTWAARGSSSSTDGGPHPDKQITIINSRLARLVAGGPERAPLAGDQLHVDLDLSHANLPAGTRVRIGEALLEVSAAPHLGCQKFSARYGLDALRFVNSQAGQELRLRGVNCRVVVPGRVRRGDPVRPELLSPTSPAASPELGDRT